MTLPADRQKFYQRRLRAERRFRCYGLGALITALAILVLLLGSLMLRGAGGFVRTDIALPVTFDAAALTEGGEPIAELPPSHFHKLAQAALKSLVPEAVEPPDQKELVALMSSAAGMELKEKLVAHPEWLGSTQTLSLPASSLFARGLHATPEKAQALGLSAQQQGWIAQLEQRGAVGKRLNTAFFTEGDSRQPERAGFLGAIVGSLMVVASCLALAFPLGVMTAVYLEEFAKPSKWVDIIEVNINNLAAVPSIVFGLLGLSVYLNFFGLPRSASLVGGMTLAMMILPVIIISTRLALRAVPDSIRDAALALGASPLQVVKHHTVPLAMPGIMTGTILGCARAIGETAPLLMIGMVAFVADVPHNPLSPATAMPVQIYLWAGSPEAGFAEKTSAGILVLLLLLLTMNALAIFIRNRFEKRW